MVVWRDLEPRFNGRTAGYWWLAAQIAIFVVGLVSLFYVVLKLALSIVWMQFLSLNVIGDIATRKRQFEIAMAVFLTVFSFFTLVAATATVLFQAQRTEGRVLRNRPYLLVGTVFLLVRSVVEIYTVVADGQPKTALVRDISYGLITCLFLAMISALAWATSLGEDGIDVDETIRIIEADIRKHIIEKLKDTTEDAKSQSPPFVEVLQQINDSDKASIIDEAIQNMGSNRDKMNELATRLADQYLKELQREFGELDPKRGVDYEWGRSQSTLLGRVSGIGRHSQVFSKVSKGSLNTLGRNRPSAQTLRASGGSQGFTPPAVGGDATSSLAPVMEPQNNIIDDFDIRSTYTMSTVPVRPYAENGWRNITDPGPQTAPRPPVGASFAARRFASSPAPSFAAQSWVHEMGDNTTGDTPSMQARQPVNPFRPAPAPAPKPQRLRAQNTSGFGSQPASSSPLVQSSGPAQPTQQHFEMRFGRATPMQQRNRARYGEVDVEMQNRGPSTMQED
ncbi:hypothetical protein CSOJ01_12912 [Colletotrichum sojae]|uniref:Uncharacterized protein n=1 Tax=Colletotrichum sojae TaxID=2175907 RepID=A0A8H6ML83_9PEZI|nr:hypothetical protein CSOJ01_12912 [Colletotrichum sojae]